MLGDRDLLVQLVENAVSNVWKYAKPGSIEVRWLVKRTGDRVALTIRHTGADKDTHALDAGVGWYEDHRDRLDSFDIRLWHGPVGDNIYEVRIDMPGGGRN